MFLFTRFRDFEREGEEKQEMVKQRRFEWKEEWPLSLSTLNTHNHLFVKIIVSLFLMGLAFRLFFSQSIGFSLISDPQLPHTALVAETPVHVMPPLQAQAPHSPKEIGGAMEAEDQESPIQKCNLFQGEWVPNPSGPVYNNESCRVVEGHQNCMKNGRPDSAYLYWRWKPQECDLPQFNSEKFLDAMRNKSWIFVGDSISRNHVQSLLCILSQVEAANEIYHDEEYKSKIWHFPSYNFTLSVIWSPFLVKAAIFEDINGVSTSETQLYLDTLDEKWTQQFKSFDYVVISGGKWFLKSTIYWENEKVIGCHHCPGKNLTELGFEYGYRNALQLVLDYTIKNSKNKLILFRTSTPDHFENGEWFSGGTCNRTVPFKDGEVSMGAVDKRLRDIELDEFEKAAAIGSEKGVNLKLLDTTHLSLLRPDGHPGPYRQLQPFAKEKKAKVQNDCLHWCLPGPIDSWNDLIMEMVLNG